MKPLEECEERIFTLSDIRRFFQKKRKKIFQIALLGGVATFSFCLLKAPKYQITATFKEGNENKSSEGVLKEMLFSAGGTLQAQAAVIMKSYQVLKPLISRLGLQAAVPRQEWSVFKACRRIRDNLKANKGQHLDEPDNFIFRDVIYEEEKGLSFFLRFDNATHFVVFDHNKKKVADGALGKEVCLSEAQFMIQKTPENLRLHRLYPLHISSWIPIADSLRNMLKITSQKLNKSIYDIVCLHRSRFRGVELVNELMAEYQHYLKESHDQLSRAQIDYLDKRQEELFQKVSENFKEYADYLAYNLGEKGFANLREGLDSFLMPYQELERKRFSIDVELSRLEQSEEEENKIAFMGENRFLIEIFKDIGELKQQRDLLELSLYDQERYPFKIKQEELKEIRSQKETSKKLFDAVLQNKEIDSSFDPGFSLSSWAKNLQMATGEERKDFASYLENHIRLLSLQEKMLQERFFHNETIPLEFEGIDLETARKLFVEYNQRLDGCEAAMRSLAQLQEEIELPQFEISSLSTVLRDPLSQKLIVQAGELAIRLKDENHHSEKEGRRWQEELNLQKKFLKDHLEQLFKVEELNTSLMREKIVGLQKISLDCINRQISVLREQARDVVKERKETLLSEKALIDEKAIEMRTSMTNLPEQWHREKWLDLKTKMGISVMETITQIVESKTIGHHLHHIESKPLDLAVLPGGPLSPHLYRMAFLGALLAGLGFFFFSLISRILRGFPSSFEKLRAMRFPLLGKLSPLCDGPKLDVVAGEDLETLRRLSLFLEKSPQAKVVALLAGKGPDYSYALMENLARRSFRSLVIRCDFRAKYQDEDLPGLLQFYNGEIAKPPIRSQNGFDVLMAGGFTPYGMELIQSKTFEDLIEKFKAKYDAIFLLFRSPLDQAESKAALRVCEKVIVTVSEEPTEILTPFIDWAYHEEDNRLTFIVTQTE